MKGIQLVTMVLILIISGLFVLVVLIFFAGTAKAQLDIENIKAELRNCCLSSSYDCSPSTYVCNNKGETVQDLAGKAGIPSSQLDDFCNCPR
jgi:hypothetical protein